MEFACFAIVVSFVIAFRLVSREVAVMRQHASLLVLALMVAALPVAASRRKRC